MATDAISYDKAELRSIVKAFKAMDEESTDQAKKVSSQLADFVSDKVKAAARQTRAIPKVCLLYTSPSPRD